MLTLALRCDLALSFGVRVGQEPNQQSFSVHHDIIIQRSAYLRDLRVQQMAEFPDSVIVLCDADPEVFNAYLHCVYFGRKSLKNHVAAMAEERPYYPENPSDDDNGEGGATGAGGAGSDAAGTDKTSKSEDETVEKFLVNLYLLAIKLIDPTTANLAINALVHFVDTDRFISNEMVHFVYNSTPKDSKLRLLFRDIHIHSMEDSWLTDITAGMQYPYDFVCEVMCRVWHLKRSKSRKSAGVTYSKELDATSYHEAVDKSSAEASTSVSKQEE